MINHKKVSIDFTNYGHNIYDLVIPLSITLKKLISLVIEDLELTIYILPNKAEILGKNILINENEYLSDTQIANGDIIKFI